MVIQDCCTLIYWNKHALQTRASEIFPEFTVTGTAVSVEEMNLSDSFFEGLIPKDKLEKN